MTVGDLLNQGGDSTMMGLAMLFCFILVLFLALYLLGKKLGSIGNNSTASFAQNAARAPISVGGGNNAQVVVAISAAIKEHQAETNRQ